jgi:outer membrane protein assembly factor BamB
MMRAPAALVLWLTCAPLALAGDWPQWLGPRRDGSSEEVVKPWQDKLTTQWQKPVGEGHSSPVVAEGRVILHARVAGKHEEAVTAFDAKTGKQLWQTTYPHVEFKSLFGNGPRATPSVAGGHVYTYGITGLLTCLDAKSGAKVWQVDCLKAYKAANLFFGASCSPLVEGDLVYINVGGKGASIVAFDKNTGEERWKALDDKASYSSGIALTQAGQRAVVFLTAQRLAALSAQDGSKYWEHPLVDKLFESSTTPVVCGDILFGSSITFGGLGLRLSEQPPPSVKEEWMKPELNCYFSTPVAVGKDHLYLVTGTKPPAIISKASLHCVEAQTGKKLWTRDKVGTYHASLLRTGDNKLLLLEEGGKLILMQPDPQEYREICSSPICNQTWAHPALSDGRLYVRDNKELRCVVLQQ